MSTFTETLPKNATIDLVKFQQSDVETLMDHHDLNEDAKYIIRTESLLPTTLLSRLHNNFPQHSLLKINASPIFSKGKNKYTGLSGFRMICEILEQHGIVLSDIIFLESDRNYITVVTTKQKLSYIDSLKNWRQKLSEHQFIQVHKSFIVNRTYVDKISGNEIYVNTNRIPIGRTFKQELLKQLKII